ncbi:MAG: class I SAM-dependent methyltransferase [Acidobacteriaceae bacterium]|nr:class I SAM-dependent methyltransferase [Acidobacteriaceae bacterium]
MVVRNTEFDPFASIYNRFWGADYHGQAFPIVEKLLLNRLPERARILDLCCGTGQFTARVERHGFRVHGVDASERMIGYARLNAPAAEFTVADARNFSLDHTFEAAYSVFESLNHVRDLSGLAMVFASVRRHLSAGAPFLFDLNREQAFRFYWNDTHAIVADDAVCALRSRYDEAARLATCDITTFQPEHCPSERDGHWIRSDFTVRQTCHDIGQVHDALSNAGFRGITLYDSQDIGMTGEIACARTFFLATV